jgi:dTDP-4-amino-4,6-dideoxygalactose transaminase
MGLLDFDRAVIQSTDVNTWNSRVRLSQLFMAGLNDNFVKVHAQEFDDAIPFALPIILSPKASEGYLEKVKKILDEAGIERRPVVGGNLLYQTCFRQYGNPKDFPAADWLHHNGLYIGLHPGVTFKDVTVLVEALNNLHLVK